MLTQEEFGKRLKEFRKEKGLTQKELAAKIDIAHTTISKWEEGALNPGLLTIMQLCEAFNVTLDEFLGVEKKTSASRLNTRRRLPCRLSKGSLNGCLTTC